MKRPTIADIAREAGVSKGAVSYALNGQPGVSDQTRRRIIAIAHRLGFQASTAARALAGARAKVIGLTLHRPPRTLGVEPFFMELISGLEAELSTQSYALLLQMVPDHHEEIAYYRRWWTERRVDGMLVCDLRTHDARIRALKELAIPAAVIGPPGELPSVWSDDAVSMVEAVEYLASLGHTRIARIAGLPDLAHTAIRTESFLKACPQGIVVATDYTAESGARATRRVLNTHDRPTALIYDNDIMAVAGVAVAYEAGLSIPDDLSIIAWDDSPICSLVHPALTALTRDIGAYGTHAARLLLDLINGAEARSRSEQPAHLVFRDSTGRCRVTP
ncbi:LacI family DNA-binding transcriptional regulator [Allorhizocola rhizosphaerae]|uniref:LacI family DNA-binding transcriptional regulator n=1 Tax=Allorhizocola rhizosphaerae TaxID=1872709 RepID=UPI000E3EB933|nr:LacI family DNA-binding transcriptional regulator [Allorhizocola rhizosphaerae]